MSTPNPTPPAPPAPRPVTLDNAILFGFKIGIGLTLWSLLGVAIVFVCFAVLGSLGFPLRIR